MSYAYILNVIAANLQNHPETDKKNWDFFEKEVYIAIMCAVLAHIITLIYRELCL